MNLRSNSESGRLPPQAIDAETAVLGALLMEQDAIVRVSDMIKGEMFYKENHALIFNAISTLFAENKQIDMITVAQQLQKEDELQAVGGAYELTKLSANVASAAHIETHAAIIHDMHVRRLLILESTKLTKHAYDSSRDLDVIINSTVGLIDRILKNTSNKAQILAFGDHLNTMCQSIQNNQKTGLNDENNLTPSCSTIRHYIPEYEPGRLIIIAGRPGMGKTAFVLNEVISFVKAGNACLFFALEMTAAQMTKRVFTAESGISKNIIDSKEMPSEYWDTIDHHVGKIYDYPLFIDDTPLATFAHVKIQSTIYKQRHDIKAIVIDYIGLMGTDGNLPREQQVSTISRQLKALSKELNIPVLALAQLNRNAEGRQTEQYKPKLSDLRESGAIEQDADIVVFPYRPEYYYKEDPTLKGKGLVIIEKNRDGNIGDAAVDISTDVSRWTCADDYCDFEEQPNPAVNAGFMSDDPF